MLQFLNFKGKFSTSFNRNRCKRIGLTDGGVIKGKNKRILKFGKLEKSQQVEIYFSKIFE